LEENLMILKDIL